MNPCEVTIHAQGKKKKRRRKRGSENVPQDSSPSKRSQYNILKVFRNRGMGKYWIKDEDEG